jgi:uncharacterized repeat protein (TIGR01451 family)
VITVSAVSERTGDCSTCISLSYANMLCFGTTVVEAGLELAKAATEWSIQCDTVELVYVVSNPGSGVASDVRIVDELPDGLRTAEGGRRVAIEVGDLAAGVSRRYEVAAQATGTGTFESAAIATGGGGLSAESEVTTTVVAVPELDVAVECPEMRYLGRPVEFTFTVANSGDAPANNAMLTAKIPANVRVESVSDNGVVEAGRVTWSLGTMRQDTERTTSVRLNVVQMGDVRAEVTASAYCAEPVTDSCLTVVKGIPAMLLEVVDLADPIELGAEEEYLITATNQGSAVATNVQIVCILPDELTFLGTSGATNATVDGQTVTFAPAARIEPKAAAVFRVRARAVGEGDVRFAVRMTSDQLTRPVEETESTTLYD